MDIARVARTLTVADLVGLVAIVAVAATTVVVASHGIDRASEAWHAPVVGQAD